MEHSSLTGRQYYYLLCLFLLGNLVTAGGAKGVHSGWLLFLLMVPVASGLPALYSATLGSRSLVSALGKPLGLCLTLFYCLLAILVAGDAIRLFADFIVINDLNDAGAWGNTALMTLIVLLLLYCNGPALGKAGWALLPLCAALLLSSVLLTAGKMDLRRLLPLFDTTPQLLIRGVIGTTAGMLAPAVFPVMALGGSVTGDRNRSAAAAGLTVCALMALLTLRDGAVLGYPMAGLFRFPGYEAAGSLRHSEAFLSAVFVLTQPFRTALCLRYVQSCLVKWRPRLRALYPPVLLLLSIISSILTWSSQRARWRTPGELAVILLVLAGPLAILLSGNRGKST